MRSSASTGRPSSYNQPLRKSTLCQDDKVLSTKSEGRRTIKPRPSGENSGIPKPRIGSDSSDGSRKSNLKQPGKTPLRSTNIMSQQTPTGMTPRAGRLHSDLPTGPRGRSPSGERGSTLGSQKMSKKDTRNLTNKTYQEALLTRIDDYFRNYNDPKKPVLNKNNSSFRPVSLLSVANGTELLLQQLEITVKPDSLAQNCMDEIQKYAKKLHYPGNISRSLLITPNAYHSYPYILGWISWLIELNDVKSIASERFDEQFNNFPDDQDIINRHLFKTLLNLYVLWNDEKFEEEKLAESEYLQTVAEYLNATTEILDNEQIEYDEIANKKRTVLDNHDKNNCIYKNSIDKLESLKNDDNKQLQYIDEQEKYKIKYEHDIQSYDIEMNEINIEIERKTNETHQLLNEIKKQPMNTQERDLKEKEYNDIRNFLKDIHEHLEELNKEIYTLDMNYSKSQADLLKALSMYNRSIIREFPENIMGKRLSEIQMPDSITFDQNSKELLKEKSQIIDELKNQMNIDYNKTMLLFNNLTKKREELQDKLDLIRHEKDELDAKNSEIKNSIKQCKIQGQEEEIKIQNQITKIKYDIQKIKETLPNLITLNDECQEINDQIEARIKKKSFIEQSAERFFSRLYSMLSNHHTDIANIMSKLDNIK